MSDAKRGVEKPSPLEIRFLESLRRRCPGYGPLLDALGNLYTQVGRHQEGLQVDLELTRLRPDDPECWYNLACSQALTGQIESSLDALRRAIALGYDDATWMGEDADLAALAGHPEFRRLVEDLQSRSGTRLNAG